MHALNKYSVPWIHARDVGVGGGGDGNTYIDEM